MTSKLMMTAATVATLMGGTALYADAHSAGFNAENAMSLSADKADLMGTAAGMPVTLMDGTQFGVVESASVDATGNAEFYIATDGYDDVVRDGEKLILTVDPKDVSMTEIGVAINVDRERLINNIASDSPDTGSYSKATVIN